MRLLAPLEGTGGGHEVVTDRPGTGGGALLRLRGGTTGASPPSGRLGTLEQGTIEKSF